MRKVIPLPDRKKMREKLYKAYKPLLDAGIPEDDIIELITSAKFWSSNRKHQLDMFNDLYKKYNTKEVNENEKEQE